MKNFLVGIFLLSLICFSFRTAEASGLSTTFSEVTLENLEIGKTYSTKEVASLPLEVVNTGKQPINLKVEPIMPQESELKAGFKPIPDLSWIKLQKSEFSNIKPNESAVTDVVFSIPNKEKYKGKKCQVFIWSHTTGGAIGIGLKSKLLLVIKGE